MDTLVLDCGNCGARVADYPREAGIPESVARIITGGCPECLAFGLDRYFDGVGRELDPATWRPVSNWRRLWRDFTSVRVGEVVSLVSREPMAESSFEAWFRKAVQYEGKVCEDVPGDAGGPTKWGVTLGRLATIKGMKTPKRGTSAFERLKSELYALSESQIKEIYRRDYWEAVKADELPPGVNFACADYGLNSGPSRAIKAMQKICGNKQTGRMDAETLREANAFDHVELIMLYQDERTRFLNAIVANRPSQRKFLRGWLNRVEDVKRAAIKLAEKEPAVEAPPTPMPKAEVPEAPPPSPTKEAARSPSIWLLLMTALGKVMDWFFGLFHWIADGIGRVGEILGGAQSETEATVAPFVSLTRTLQLNLGDIVTWLTIGLLLVVVFRHLGDKVRLAHLKQQAGEAE